MFGVQGAVDQQSGLGAGATDQAHDSFIVGQGLPAPMLADLTKEAMLHRIPVIYPIRPFTEAGGLMSYGTSLTDTYRQAGVYAGRILKGAKPAELPVQAPTVFNLVINLRAVEQLGLTLPRILAARADELIE